VRALIHGAGERGEDTCSIFCTLASVFSFLRSLAPMRGPAGAFRENRMFEPVIGLIVAVLLGAYLAYTLLHPEKF